MNTYVLEQAIMSSLHFLQHPNDWSTAHKEDILHMTTRHKNVSFRLYNMKHNLILFQTYTSNKGATSCDALRYWQKAPLNGTTAKQASVLSIMGKTPSLPSSIVRKR